MYKVTGDLLREALKDKGLSNIDLSLLTGISEPQISNTINGNRRIGVKFAVKLESLGIETADFWCGLTFNIEITKERGVLQKENEQKVNELLEKAYQASGKKRLDILGELKHFI